jgi:hypothetical protein
MIYVGDDIVDLRFPEESLLGQYEKILETIFSLLIVIAVAEFRESRSSIRRRHAGCHRIRHPSVAFPIVAEPAPKGLVSSVEAMPLRFVRAEAWARAAAFAASACWVEVVAAEGAAGAEGISAMATPVAAAPIPAAIRGMNGINGAIKLFPLNNLRCR